MARVQHSKLDPHAVGTLDRIPTSLILQPAGGRTRPLDPAHVVTLAESIAALGLIEPVVVDRTGTLLAGGHRLAAVKLLVERDPIARVERFQRDAVLPVRPDVRQT